MRPYPAYKDSGVEWLGEVPEGWEVKRLRHLVRVKTDKATTATNPIALENIESWSGRITPTDTEFQGDGTAFEAGDILFGKLRPYLAKVAIAHCSGEAVGDFHVLRPSAGVLPRFIQLGLLTPSVISIIDGSTYGSKMPRASWDFMADLCFALPPLPEQQAIARFLDKEVAKIDALVAEQRRLIALLAEKRQAVISHAVTKGLNPATPLKPSGIDWLGDIPEGWEVVPLRRVLNRIEQGFSPECFAYPAEAGEWGVLKAGCVNRGIYAELENKALPPEIEPRPDAEVKVGDVLMSRASGSPELIGSVALVRTTQGRIMLSDKIFRLKLNNQVAPSFFAWVMGSTVVRAQIVNAISGGEGMANNLPQGEIKEFFIALPPVARQIEVAAYLDAQTAQFDALTTTAQSAISLLQERRAALISAAVTGKIDLRAHFAQSLSEPESA